MEAGPSRNRDDSEGFHQNPKAISVGPWGGKGGDSWDDGVYLISVGPWGGKGGSPWNDNENEVYAGIHQIKLVYGDVINSINIEYVKDDGSFEWKEHLGSGGNKTAEFILDYPKERITSISGRYDTDQSVRSLKFESNVKKYGPYGVENGTSFSLPMAEGKLVGFHGRSDVYLDCIGVNVSKIPKAISVGPWGGKGGDSWDDEVYTQVYAGISQIILVHEGVIHSINIKYQRDKDFVWSKHGGSGGNNTATIELEYPKERITSISGHYDTYLRSLTFESNLKPYGPYGVEDGTYFSLPMAEGKIVGFHGRSGSYLDCIGVYISKVTKEIEDGNEKNDTVGSI